MKRTRKRFGGVAPRITRGARGLVVASAFVPAAVLFAGPCTADDVLPSPPPTADVTTENMAPQENSPADAAVIPFGPPLPPAITYGTDPAPGTPPAGGAVPPDVISTTPTDPAEPDGPPTPDAPSGNRATEDAPAASGSRAAQDVPTGSAGHEDIASGSAVIPDATTGSAADGGHLSLEPSSLPATNAILDLGPAADADADTTGSATPATGATANPAVLGLDSGSVVTACAGSAVTAGALLFLGSAAGSGLIGPGMLAPPWWAFVGSAGSVVIPPGFGSSGSALGSAAVGSAVTGSAVLTCLLALSTAPTPPTPSFPLLIPSPILSPPLSFFQPATAPVAAPAGSETAIAPERFAVAATPPVVDDAAAATADQFAFNTLEIITLLVVLTILAYQSSTEVTKRRPPRPLG
ncbi:hypothetical protein ACFYO1_14885 [Nocardia sp. NPDC006044]|uniref:hypothetical protein n=1 Tax=Nocardia sp. NPDC006044 TaxID=3364306 RepID=UPI0036B12C20